MSAEILTGNRQPEVWYQDITISETFNLIDFSIFCTNRKIKYNVERLDNQQNLLVICRKIQHQSFVRSTWYKSQLFQKLPF